MGTRIKRAVKSSSCLLVSKCLNIYVISISQRSKQGGDGEDQGGYVAG